MARSRTFDIPMIVTTPVGSRVEVSIFKRPKVSAWDGSVKDWDGEVVPDEVLVRDLGSGILYGMQWHFREGVGVETVAGAEPLPQLELVERIEGTVGACRVLAVRQNGGRQHHSTRLVIDVGSRPPSSSPPESE